MVMASNLHFVGGTGSLSLASLLRGRAEVVSRVFVGNYISLTTSEKGELYEKEKFVGNLLYFGDVVI
jgi:hypothetical protein